MLFKDWKVGQTRAESTTGAELLTLTLVFAVPNWALAQRWLPELVFLPIVIALVLGLAVAAILGCLSIFAEAYRIRALKEAMMFEAKTEYYRLKSEHLLAAQSKKAM